MHNYFIPIEKFQCGELLLRINGSHWPKVGWISPKIDDTIHVIGRTRTIKFVYSSDGGAPTSHMYFRPADYFENKPCDPIIATAMIQIDLNK